jgi:L-histidine N-alpha-methyltransferase
VSTETGETRDGGPDPLDDELDAVFAGLQEDQKVISSRYFYDTRGSELFVRITKLPEYYPTRTEHALLEQWGSELIRRFGPAALLELGAGSARKTRVLLDAMEARGTGGHYLPLDVSADFLEETASKLREEYPHLEVRPVVGDLAHPLDRHLDVPRPLLVAFLGSTIGNFARPGALGILSNIADFLSPGDHLLLGADLRPSRRKPLQELEAAYNDSLGVTADFNRNAMRVLNARFGTDFRPETFEHWSFYDASQGRIEMHLVALSAQTVRVPGRGEIRFKAGETVRTEISCKYDHPTVTDLFTQAGLSVDEWWTDDHERYALVVGSPT